MTPKPSTVKAQVKRRNRQYKKGDIYKITQGDVAPVGCEMWAERPGLIVSNNISNNRAGFVQVVYLTTSTIKRTSPTHIPIGTPIDDKETLALTEQIHTVDLSRVTRHLGFIDFETMRKVEAGICFALSIGHNPETYALFKKWDMHIKSHGVDLKKEIEALSHQTTDDRVTSLERALALMSTDRDAYKQLYENLNSRLEAPLPLPKVA